MKREGNIGRGRDCVFGEKGRRGREDEGEKRKNGSERKTGSRDDVGLWMTSGKSQSQLREIIKPKNEKIFTQERYNGSN